MPLGLIAGIAHVRAEPAVTTQAAGAIEVTELPAVIAE